MTTFMPCDLTLGDCQSVKPSLDVKLSYDDTQIDARDCEKPNVSSFPFCSNFVDKGWTFKVKVKQSGLHQRCLDGITIKVNCQGKDTKNINFLSQVSSSRFVVPKLILLFTARILSVQP